MSDVSAATEAGTPGLFEVLSDAEGARSSSGNTSRQEDTAKSASPTKSETSSSGSATKSGTSSRGDPPAYDDDHHAAYIAQQKAAVHRTTFELDGRPLPDLEHHYYDEFHDPEPEDEPSHDFKDFWRSHENFKAYLTKNHHFHEFIAFLIVLDILIVLGELILDLEILRADECAHDHDCPLVEATVNGSMWDCSFNSNYTTCLYKGGRHTCVDEYTKADKDPSEILHKLSIAVLSCFVLESIVRLVVLQREFFKRKLEVFDSIVVTTALFLDIFVHHGAAVALLLFVRLWRVTRIINGIAIAMESREEAKRHELRKQNRCARHELVRKRETVHLLRIELMEWKKAAAVFHEAEHFTVAAPMPTG
ncbi:uncharacterized protein LOC135819193 [Sycon ciliatum]|uniref:uncharacterized protein LOC135819193 n=1 Tax=Sycon ciliatum TaxID=27933 RepID=UPI0020A8C326|eukprot:scpid90481/ scgid29112/ Voltage-gated hydrogen channel 1; Hydrogen voltage-gated channel 1